MCVRVKLSRCVKMMRCFFSDFYHFGIFSCGTWAADACCKSYRHNKRCLVLNIHAASREQFPYRCAIRVIPLKETRKRREKNSPLLCGLLSCQAGLCAIDSHSVVFSDAKRRRGGGGWGRVGWRWVGGVWIGGVGGCGKQTGESRSQHKGREKYNCEGGSGRGSRMRGCSRGDRPRPALRLAEHTLQVSPLSTAGLFHPRYRCFSYNLLIFVS